MIRLEDDWQDAAAWDAFVARHGEGRFCQLFGYGAVLACYGYVQRNICFLKDREIVAVLPAVQVNSLLFGKRVVSQPFSEYGGLLLDPQLSEDDFGEIFHGLKTYGRSLAGVDSIEMHGNHGVPQDYRDNWATPSVGYHLAVLPLDRSVDELWRKVIDHAARKKVNQAAKKGVTVEFRCNEQLIRHRFFPLYLLSMKRLGVPPHSINYFLRLHEIYGDKMNIAWAKKDDKSISGLLGLRCGDRVSVICIASDPEGWSLRPNDLVHWEFLKWAVQNEVRNFDFGSVRYDGQADFKKKWGCNLLTHKLYILPLTEGAAPRALDSSSRSMSAMANLWSRFVPIGPGKVVGPMIRKHLAR